MIDVNSRIFIYRLRHRYFMGSRLLFLVPRREQHEIHKPFPPPNGVQLPRETKNVNVSFKHGRKVDQVFSRSFLFNPGKKVPAEKGRQTTDLMTPVGLLWA